MRHSLFYGSAVCLDGETDKKAAMTTRSSVRPIRNKMPTTPTPPGHVWNGSTWVPEGGADTKMADTKQPSQELRTKQGGLHSEKSELRADQAELLEDQAELAEKEEALARREKAVALRELELKLPPPDEEEVDEDTYSRLQRSWFGASLMSMSAFANDTVVYINSSMWYWYITLFVFSFKSTPLCDEKLPCLPNMGPAC